MAPQLPTPEQLAQMNNEWVEPANIVQVPEGISYGLYDAKARGEGLQGSYWYILPDYYEVTTTTYPVLFWLHGGMSRASQGFDVARLYKQAMTAGTMPQTILVLPQALPVGWYINSVDQKYPIENVMMDDLLPHIDKAFRTNGKRAVEGFSMGGYGALHLGFKFADRFKAISSIGPAVLESLADEPKERVWDTFGGDQEYYDQNHPANLARERCLAIRSANLRIRILVGCDDSRLLQSVKRLGEALNISSIPHRTVEIPGIGHDCVAIMEAIQPETFTFWGEVFKD